MELLVPVSAVDGLLFVFFSSPFRNSNSLTRDVIMTFNFQLEGANFYIALLCSLLSTYL